MPLLVMAAHPAIRVFDAKRFKDVDVQQKLADDDLTSTDFE
jgi:hypothetical protein